MDDRDKEVDDAVGSVFGRGASGRERRAYDLEQERYVQRGGISCLQVMALIFMVVVVIAIVLYIIAARQQPPVVPLSEWGK